MSWLDPGAGVLGAFLQGKPKLPGFTALNPQLEQSKAIAGNEAALPGLENLAGQINTFSTQQIDQMLQTAMPWYNQVRGQVGGLLKDELSGKIPGDVQEQVQNSAAAKAVSGGFAGSGMHGDLVARDLGLTSLDITQKGLSSAESWIGLMDKIYSQGKFDVTSMFITPQQQYQMDTEQAGLQFQHDWSQNLINWQSSPGYIIGGEMIKDSDAIAQMASQLIGSVGGKALGAAI